MPTSTFKHFVFQLYIRSKTVMLYRFDIAKSNERVLEQARNIENWLYF